MSYKKRDKGEDVRDMDNGVKNPESVTASIWAVIIREGKKKKKKMGKLYGEVDKH